jgi:hypothetical protein
MTNLTRSLSDLAAEIRRLTRTHPDGLHPWECEWRPDLARDATLTELEILYHSGGYARADGRPDAAASELEFLALLAEEPDRRRDLVRFWEAHGSHWLPKLFEAACRSADIAWEGVGRRGVAAMSRLARHAR